MSKTLVWNEYIKSVKRKLSKITLTGSLYNHKIRRCIPKAILRNLYYALVNFQLMYGISIWGSGGSISISSLSCLFSAQRKWVLTLYGDRYCMAYIETLISTLYGDRYDFSTTTTSGTVFRARNDNLFCSCP